MPEPVRVTKVILTGSYSPFSLLVMLSTWSKYSHAGFELSDGSFLDAHPLHGVSIREMPKKTSVYKEYKITNEVIGLGLFHRACSQLGKKYDWEWILGYPFNRNWQDPSDWVCFEFVAWSLRNTVRIGKKLHRVTGRELERVLDRLDNV